MTANSVRFGPGTFTLGSEATAFDCQVQSMGISVDKSTGDDITVMCGDVILGGSTYAYSLAGVFLQDFAVAGGIVEYSWIHKGETVDFTFTPSEPAATSATGQVVIDPLPFGDSGAAYGDLLTADFEWAMQGEPVYTWPTAAPEAARAARGRETVDA